MAGRPTNTTGLTHLTELVRRAVPPIHPAGRPFIAAGLATTVLGWRWKPLRCLGLAAALGCAGFFRHPHRVTPSDPRLIIAAADGEICLIEDAVPPAELGWLDQPCRRVSTFLSILDVHVQRAPIAGQIVTQVHTPGQFLSADLPEASQANERNAVLLRSEAGVEVAVVQIAGLVARRIISQVNAGEVLEAGQTYGLIRFGSRVDLYLPANAQLAVELGQRAIGGETVIARLP